MIYILIHPKLGLCLVPTLQHEISLTQSTIARPTTIGFQQSSSSPTGLHS